MSKSSEEIAARWLGGRGTKVLYSAIMLAIVGTLMTAGAMSTTRDQAAAAEVEIRKAVELATEVQDLCEDQEFARENPGTCANAAELLTEPSPGSVPAGTDVLEAVGIPR